MDFQAAAYQWLIVLLCLAVHVNVWLLWVCVGLQLCLLPLFSDHCLPACLLVLCCSRPAPDSIACLEIRSCRAPNKASIRSNAHR